MEAKSLRMQQKKLQRVKLLEREMFSSPPMPLDIPAYPPIFLSPSSFSDPFTPSPSPLPAAGGNNHSLAKAAIIGGSVAGVVALAVTATVISTVAGKVGASCLLGPAINLFSCLFQKFFTPCASKLKSLCSTLNRCKAGSKKKAAADDDDAVDDLYTIILGGSPNTAAKAESELAAATYSLATSPLRDVMKGGGNQPVTSAHEFLAASLSEFAESELNKQKAMMMQVVNEQTAKAQGYAQSLIFSVTDNVNDDLGALKKSADAHLTEVSQLKANTDLMKASTETIAAVWKHPEDVAITIFDETLRAGAEKIKNTIAHESEEGMKKLQKLREKVALQEEVVLQGLLGKPTRTSSKESHESGDEEAKQEVKDVEYIVESASDAYEEVQSEENTDQRTKLAETPHKKDEERGEGDAAKRHINSASRVAAATGGGGEGAIVPVPSKALAAATSREDAVQGKRTTARKAKRPSNLGHVSFSCEMSAHRLRFFTSCRSGGTYGSPPPSPSLRPRPHHHSHPYDRSIITGSHDVHSRNRGDYQSTVPLYNGVHLAPATGNHFHLMHQQHQPAQSILLQSNAAAYDSPLAQHTASLPQPIDTTPRAGSPSARLDYGSPFDGVL